MNKKDNTGRFIKGQSGNPGGRPATPDTVKTMLKAATEGAVQLMIDTVNDTDAKPDLRVRCAEYICDRVLGKPTQPIEAIMSTPAIDLSGITVDELRRLAAYDESEKTSDSEGSAE